MNEGYLNRLDVGPIAAECARIFPYNGIEAVNPSTGAVVTDLGLIEPTRQPLLHGPDVTRYAREIDNAFYNAEDKMFKAGYLKRATFMTRQFEIIERLAITNAVGCDRREILREDYDYATAVVKACMGRASDYLETIGSDSRFQKDMAKVKRIISNSEPISRTKLLRNSHMESKQLNAVVQTLIENETIEVFNVAGQGSVTHYGMVR